MRLLIPLLALLPAALAIPESLTLYAIPHALDTASHSTPTPLATIQYDRSTLKAELESYTPPSGSYGPSHLISIGIPIDSSASNGLNSWPAGKWSVVATSAKSFDLDQTLRRKATLLVNKSGDPIHVSFRSWYHVSNADPTVQKSMKADKTGRVYPDLEIEVFRQDEGPRPVLNTPVVTKDGKAATPGEGEEDGDSKTFLQKYWWMIAIFLVLQIVAGSGGKE